MEEVFEQPNTVELIIRVSLVQLLENLQLLQSSLVPGKVWGNTQLLYLGIDTFGSVMSTIDIHYVSCYSGTSIIYLGNSLLAVIIER